MNDVNGIKENVVIPEGMMALIKKNAAGQPTTIWFGRCADVPTHEFEIADEAHVGPETHKRFAEALVKTGKGTPEAEWRNRQ